MATPQPNPLIPFTVPEILTIGSAIMAVLIVAVIALALFFVIRSRRN
jgi:hypothetical protein